WMTLALQTSGPLSPQLAHSSVLFGARSGTRSVDYGGLQAMDARGTALPVRLLLVGRLLLLRVNDRGARYPLTVDPFLQQGGKLTPNDETGAGAFGKAVALSGDGNTALVGGSGDNSSVGAAWVFVRSGGTWSQQGGKLTASDETGQAAFGESVAMSGDGNIALI